MDPVGVGVLIGFFSLIMIGAGLYIYDRCVLGRDITTAKPLLSKKRPFKVKNLFSHVEI